jgi:CBS domain-containing protein
MVISQTELKSEVIELSTKAFETFYKDISDMFSVKMGCAQKKVSEGTIDDIRKHFGGFIAVNTVKAEGALDGSFQLIFDQEGLSTLAGVLIMLPEEQILENRNNSVEYTKELSDAIGEVGNLLVGAWDKVFRENMEGHGDFAQTNSFIGEPWDEPEAKIGLSENTELVLVSYAMTLGSSPACNCGVIFPKALLGETSEADTQPASDKQETTTEEEPSAEEKAPVDEKATSEEASAEQEASVEQETATKEQASAEEKTHAEKADDETAVVEESKESAGGEISETIQRMTQSPPEPPKEDAPSPMVENQQFSIAGSSSAACAKDIMQKEVLWGSADDSVQQALTKMQQADSGYMMIGEDGAPEGIVSKSDITGAISPYLRPIFAKWHRPLDDATLQIKVKWIMSRPVHTVKPETSLVNIMRTMRQSGLRALPVMDQQGKIQGMVTVFDIFKALISEDSEAAVVGKTSQAPPLA